MSRTKYNCSARTDESNQSKALLTNPIVENDVTREKKEIMKGCEKFFGEMRFHEIQALP